jgi:hypothetical protein
MNDRKTRSVRGTCLGGLPGGILGMIAGVILGQLLGVAYGNPPLLADCSSICLSVLCRFIGAVACSWIGTETGTQLVLTAATAPWSPGPK